MNIERKFESAFELYHEGNLLQAEMLLKEIVHVQPNNTNALYLLAEISYRLGNYDSAIQYIRNALQYDPTNAEGYSNLGFILQGRGQLDEAVQCYQKALQLNPHLLEAHSNLGNVFKEKGQFDDAIRCYQRALQLDPDYATAHWNLALALLLTGNFREGWREYEWRWETQYLASSCRNFKEPLWDGSDIKGRTILLHAEQGFGDTIQFIRYAPSVAERGAKIIFECPGELAALLRSVEGIEQVVVRGEELPAFDIHCPLLSLPLAFDTTIGTIPGEERRGIHSEMEGQSETG